MKKLALATLLGMGAPMASAKVYMGAFVESVDSYLTHDSYQFCLNQISAAGGSGWAFDGPSFKYFDDGGYYLSSVGAHAEYQVVTKKGLASVALPEGALNLLENLNLLPQLRAQEQETEYLNQHLLNAVPDAAKRSCQFVSHLIKQNNTISYDLWKAYFEQEIGTYAKKNRNDHFGWEI